MCQRRSGITLMDMLALLALLAVLLGLMIPAVPRIRQAAKRAESMNNLKQLALAFQDWASSNSNFILAADKKGFSTSARLLPYIEQDNVYKRIDFTKPIDDKANAAARKTQIKLFLSPLDPMTTVKNDWGATNYLYNDQIFALDKNVPFPTYIQDGTSNTVIIGETLKGDNGKKAVSVQRQYVLLDKKALEDIKDDAGVEDFKNDKHIAGDRCASWMDGHFLQGTFNARLRPNDKRPDVSCGGAGGLSALRSLDTLVPVAMADGSARTVGPGVSLKTWRIVVGPQDGEVPGSDW